MKTQELPIYRATYQLLEQITTIARNFPRDLKISLAGKLQDECVELVVGVYRANFARQGRKALLERVLERVQTLELLIRLCSDMRLITTKKQAALVELTDSIGRQAQGWWRASA